MRNHTSARVIPPGVSGRPSARLPSGAPSHRIRFGCRITRQRERRRKDRGKEREKEEKKEGRNGPAPAIFVYKVVANGYARAEVNRAASYRGFLAGGVQRRAGKRRVASRRPASSSAGGYTRFALDFSSGLFISALIFSLSVRSMAPSRPSRSFSLTLSVLASQAPRDPCFTIHPK